MATPSGIGSRFNANFLANKLCGGSARKLIAGWWYTILALSLVLTIMSLWIVSTRSSGEGFCSVWTALILVLLSIGGTTIMRKFQNSIAVGFFIGAVVATAQLFFLVFLIYMGYDGDRRQSDLDTKEEMVIASFSLMQAILLGSFAAILGVYRSEILDRPRPQQASVFNGDVSFKGSAYDPPNFA
eukprot:CAMPEP_0195520744 /NCGR_PEP_ID=MMETSP0794_2-20130614/17522_1 /TAXON_ID=515487 /ORGANISM="Stephanopyxis turris, Strain CCMP 815" /LENGTH=184 /DNA_ID=CAMNT_0040650163 /DNA_START=78 /DNA_END=632 /DNA_ORIENTATION=+